VRFSLSYPRPPPPPPPPARGGGGEKKAAKVSVYKIKYFIIC